MYSHLALFLQTILDNAEPSCTKEVFLTLADRLIFWIGGSIVFLVTLFLLLGALISKRLREQPGDLVVGIAFSDFLLSIHWITLASFYHEVNDPTFCAIVGGIGTFAGINEFLYNVSFSVFLIVSLRNALKQSKIPKKLFHVVNILIAGGYVGYLFGRGEIGKTIVGTCSIKTQCNSNFLSYLGTLVIACYTLVGAYTYTYVKKHASQCQRAHKKRTSFLLYYLKYIIACLVVYILITLTNLVTTIVSNSFLNDGDDTLSQEEREKYEWINSIYNVAKLCSPLALSFVRLNDPKIKAVVKQGIFFWRRDLHRAAQVQVPLVANPDGDEVVPANLLRSQSLENSGLLLMNLNVDKKNEITYTLLSCVVFARYHFQHPDQFASLEVYDSKTHNRFKQERVFTIDTPVITSALPSIQQELDRTKYTLLSGTLKVYAPEVFGEFVNNESDWLDFVTSLDFFENKQEIKDASGSDGGKSGEFFFFSKDKKLIIKTVPDVELKMLISVLERYSAHLNMYTNSLIAKIYGAYTYENTDLGLKFNLIVMKNICGYPSKFVERKYDMKGSKYDRETLKGQETVSEETLRTKVLKDSDFDKYEKKLFLKPDVAHDFKTQVELDSLFLRSVQLIDYSFMVYIVNKQKAIPEIPPEKDFTAKNGLASAEHAEKPGLYYNMGIIDYLQPYNFQKKFERFLKRVKKLDPNLDTSSQDPEYYSTRFIQFMKNIST